MLLYTFVLATVLSLIYYYLKHKRSNDLADKFPGPPVLPIIGNLFNFTATSVEGIRFYKDGTVLNARCLLSIDSNFKFYSQRHEY